MPNKLITPDVIVAETLRLVHQEANFIGNINTSYDRHFAKRGAKVGDTIEVRLPNRYRVRQGAKMSVQPTEERKKKIRLTHQKGIDIAFTSKELTLDLDRFSERFLAPAAKALVADIESEILAELHPKVTSWSWVGRADRVFTRLLEGNERLDAKLCPRDRRTCLMSPPESGRLVDELKGLFNPQERMTSLYKTGALGRTANNQFFTNTHLSCFSEALASSLPDNEHTRPEDGYEKSFEIVLHAPINRMETLTDQPTDRLTLSLKIVKQQTPDPKNPSPDATETTYIPLGDRIKPGTGLEIKDLVMLHAQTLKPLPYSWRGVVVACKDSADDAEASEVTIDPPIVWQETPTVASNVTHITGAPELHEGSAVSMPVLAREDDRPVRLMLQMDRDAFVFGTADLMMPEGVDFKSRQHHEGISMRIIRKYDYKEDTFPCRIDVLYGYEYLRDELAHKYFCESERA